MEPVSNVDRLVHLLRQQLSERARSEKGAVQTGRSSQRRETRQGIIAALGAIEGVDERVLRRSFIQSLLSEQLGEQFVNDARFQQVVAQVTEAIDADDGARALLDRQVASMKQR